MFEPNYSVSKELQDLFGVNAKRIALTASCNDCETLPRVPDAGQFAGTDNSLQIMHNGIQVVRDGYDGAWMTEIIRRLKGHHEPQEELVFHHLLERLQQTESSPTMIELGSYWSFYSLWFLKEFPKGRAICVEPDPRNLSVGRKNAELNSMEILFHQALIGDRHLEDTEIQFRNDEPVIRISTETLESLFEKFTLDHLDILHSDIQGFELPLLESSAHILKQGKVRFVVFSTHHSSISGDDFTHEKCREIITSAGGHIIAEHTVAESFSGDGLLVASFDARDRDFTVSVSVCEPWNSLFSEAGILQRAEIESRREEVILLNQTASALDQSRVKDAETFEELIHNKDQEISTLLTMAEDLTSMIHDRDEKLSTVILEVEDLRIEVSRLITIEEQLVALLKSRTFRWTVFLRKICRRV